jgi:hypothetical protein
MGEIKAVYKDLELAFGIPLPGDEFKVSGEWIFKNDDGVVFTLYDWKSTSLYDDGLPSVEEFRTYDKPVHFNIGGNHKGDVDAFKEFIKASIDYAKVGKPFEEAVMKIEDAYCFDDYSITEIDMMILNGIVTEEEVVKYYGNQWWRETP